ncbi:SDR family oxidoreductase [Pseudoalteromonas sp. BDTF-M6]|uniref:UDP-glucose 4-epimerase family protein n=1 Tax=Pseudoalteromonas sp. BDTF-M6 TaxID=2796132 RepID=UPI0032D5AC67
MNILITGYSGFLGTHLLSRISDEHKVTLVGRSKPTQNGFKYVHAQLNKEFNFSSSLLGCDVVIHAAARVHVMSEKESDPLSVFRELNTHATIKLATQAAEAGVKRFIFISSIKVNGESTTGRRPFSVQDDRAPEDPYGISKAEAEEQLLHISRDTGMEVVIIRPPLVYGEGGKGNFSSLMNFVKKGYPLPFRCIKSNKRSFVSVYNLVDLINVCINHAKAANQVFLVSDNHDLSTAEMVALMATVQDKTNFTLPIPLWCYKIAGKVLNKKDVVERLIGSLQVDVSHTMDTLDWKPPYSLEAGFKLAAKGKSLGK